MLERVICTMKLYKDGTIEGTPQEMAEYNKLMYPRNINVDWTRASKSENPYQPTLSGGTTTGVREV